MKTKISIILLIAFIGAISKCYSQVKKQQLKFKFEKGEIVPESKSVGSITADKNLILTLIKLPTDQYRINKIKLRNGINEFKDVSIISKDSSSDTWEITKSDMAPLKLIALIFYREDSIPVGDTIEISVDHIKDEGVSKPKVNNVSFLPSAEEYLTLISEASTFTKIQIPDNEYRIVLDFKNNHITYPEPWLCGKNKKVVNLNKNIVYQVININPLIYDVSFNHTFINRNIEFEGKIVQILTPESKTDGDGIAESKEVVTENDLLEMFFILKNELTTFYQEKISDPSPDLYLYKSELELIKTKIQNIFTISGDVNRASLLKKGAELLSVIGSEDANKLYQPAIDSSARLIELLSNINYSIASEIIEPGNNDEINFEVAIKKGDDFVWNSTKYSIMISGGFKADFSVGFYLTALKDELYTLKNVESTDTTFYQDPFFIETDSILNIDKINQQLIIRDDLGKNDIGMMLAAHFYPRTGYRFNIALTTGFGIDTDHSTRYMVGASVLWGFEKRFSLTYGHVWGEVKTLASSLKEGEYYSGNADQLHKEVLKDNWFVALTYNFGSLPLTNNTKKD